MLEAVGLNQKQVLRFAQDDNLIEVRWSFLLTIRQMPNQN